MLLKGEGVTSYIIVTNDTNYGWALVVGYDILFYDCVQFQSNHTLCVHNLIYEYPLFSLPEILFVKRLICLYGVNETISGKKL